MADYIAVTPTAYKDQDKFFPPSYKEFEQLRISFSDQSRYLIAEKLGYGKYSDVFKGYRRGDSSYSPIVIKVLKPVRYVKVYREVKILTNLFYGPFIMKLLDACNVENSQYPAFITEFGGVSLQSVSSGLTARQLKLFIGQLLLALHYCHIHGIIHRDVKGGNICVDLETGRLTLLDFGLAEFYSYGRPLHHRVATRHYKSPELLCSYQLYDYSLDVWSTGAMLAGFVFMRQPFFRGNDNDDQLVKILNIMGSSEFSAFLNKYKIKLDRQRMQELRDFKRIPLEQFVNNQNKHLATPEVIDLLYKMLQIDPEKRWTCRNLLTHSWFDDVREELVEKYISEYEVIKHHLETDFREIPEPCFPSYEYIKNTQYPTPISPNELMKREVIDESEWENTWACFQRKGNQIGWQIQKKLIDRSEKQ